MLGIGQRGAVVRARAGVSKGPGVGFRVGNGGAGLKGYFPTRRGLRPKAHPQQGALVEIGQAQPAAAAAQPQAVGVGHGRPQRIGVANEAQRGLVFPAHVNLAVGGRLHGAQVDRGGLPEGNDPPAGGHICGAQIKLQQLGRAQHRGVEPAAAGRKLDAVVAAGPAVNDAAVADHARGGIKGKQFDAAAAVGRGFAEAGHGQLLAVGRYLHLAAVALGRHARRLQGPDGGDNGRGLYPGRGDAVRQKRVAAVRGAGGARAPAVHDYPDVATVFVQHARHFFGRADGEGHVFGGEYHLALLPNGDSDFGVAQAFGAAARVLGEQEVARGGPRHGRATRQPNGQGAVGAEAVAAQPGAIEHDAVVAAPNGVAVAVEEQVARAVRHHPGAGGCHHPAVG